MRNETHAATAFVQALGLEIADEQALSRKVDNAFFQYSLFGRKETLESWGRASASREIRAKTLASASGIVAKAIDDFDLPVGMGQTEAEDQLARLQTAMDVLRELASEEKNLASAMKNRVSAMAPTTSEDRGRDALIVALHAAFAEAVGHVPAALKVSLAKRNPLGTAFIDGLEAAWRTYFREDPPSETSLQRTILKAVKPQRLRRK